MYKIIFTGITCCLFLVNEPIAGSSSNSSNPTFGVHATQKGIWSVLNNPAGLAGVNRYILGSFYQSTFLLNELSTKGFSIAVPLKTSGVLAGGYRQFGYHLYKEQYGCIAFSRELGKSVSAGVRFDYLSYKFGENYGQSSTVTGSAGVIVKVNEPVRVGVSVFNPSRVRMSKESTTRLPVVIQGGITWAFSKHAELAAGMELASDKDEVFCFDFIYNVSDKFRLQCGVSDGDHAFYFGYSFKVARINIGMISGYNDLLGFSPQFSLTYNRN